MNVLYIHGMTIAEDHTYDISPNGEGVHSKACICGHRIEREACTTNGTYKYYSDMIHTSNCKVCGQTMRHGHTGVSHSSEGKCTDCGAQIEEHSKSSTISSYKKGANTHTPLYKCTYSGCTSTYTGTAVKHEGGTHPSGKCKVCNYTYESHGQSTTISSYTTTETQHTPVYKCTESDCTSTYTGTAANHEGGTHEDGKCTVCEQVYQTHTMSTTPTSYETTETQHIPVYTCTYVDTDGTKCVTTEKGPAENHTGGTHEDGKCTVCEQVYQTHTISTTPTSYETTETQHIPVYTCTYVDANGTKCIETEKGPAEDHTGGTHEDGKCTVCEEVYQTHTMSTTPTSYETTETQHTPVYTCTYVDANGTKCATTTKGTAENHEVEQWTDNTNGTHSGNCKDCTYKLTEEHNYNNGKCTDCNATEPTQECTHAYISKNNDTQHWEECSKCKQVKAGSKENHTYGEYVDNKNGTHTATCTKCGYKLTENHTYKNENCEDCKAVKPNENCEHKYEQKNNSIQHWEECSKCNQVKTGSAENHTYGKYEDNKDGTHSSTCTKCNYKLTEKHTYKDEKCEECEVAKPGEKCEHTYGEYVDNKDGTHTTICKKCGEKLTEKHSYKDAKCENCGSKKDATIVDKEIPKAGSKSIPVILIGMLLSGICIVSVYKVKKYKNI